MKLVAVRTARSIWLLPQYFLNPRGTYLRPLLALLRERYSFQSLPSENAKITDPDGLKFENGAFQAGGRTIHVVSFTIFADGLVAETRSSTSDSDSFLKDALDFGREQFALPSHSDLPFKRVYASELNVSYLHEPQLLHPALRPFLSALTRLVSDERSPHAGLVGLAYGVDQSLSDRPPFRFEREVRTPFNEHRFYSFAPFETDKHMELLARLDEVTDKETPKTRIKNS